MNYANIKNQRGVTFWGFIWSTVLFLLACYLVIIAIPPYLNNQKIYRALEAVAHEPKVMTMHRSQLLRILKRKLVIDSADEVVNLNRAFKVKLVGSNRDLSIDYEVVIPIAYNVSLLFDFRNHILAPLR